MPKESVFVKMLGELETIDPNDREAFNAMRMKIVEARMKEMREEEQKEVNDIWDELFADVMVCRKVIANKHGDGIPKDNIVDYMDCPKCSEGIICYTISNYNGHCHGQCTTKGCINWTE